MLRSAGNSIRHVRVSRLLSTPLRASPLRPAYGLQAGYGRAFSVGVPSMNAATPTEAADKMLLEDLPSNAMTADTSVITGDASVEMARLTQAAAGDIGMRFGDLQAMGLEKAFYNPVGIAQSLLEAIHITTGMPWWATIAATTVIIRLGTLPLIVSVQRNAALMNNIRPKLDMWKDRMVKATSQKDRQAAAQASEQYRLVLKESGAKPARMIVMPLTNGAIFISFFMALRQMSELPVPHLADGGMLWFQNLNAADPYYILPLLATAGFLANFELGSELGGKNVMTGQMKNIFRGVAVLMPFMTYSFPASVFMYWLTTNMFSIGQVVILQRPAVRKALGIPVMIQHPKVEGQGLNIMGTFNKTMEDLKKGATEAANEPMTSEGIIKKARQVSSRPSRRPNRFKR